MQRQVNAPVKALDRWSGHLLGRALGGITRLFGRFGDTGPPRAPSRILLIKFCCMGDAILMQPSLRALRSKFPAAKITMLCTPRTSAIFQDSPDLDEVLQFELTGAKGGGEFLRAALSSLAGVVRELRSRRFDVVVDFDNYYNWTTFLAFATGAPVRVGFDAPGQGRRHLLTHPVPHAGQRHMVEIYLDLARAIGADTADKSIALPLAPEADRKALEFYAGRGRTGDGRPIVLLSPGRSEAWHFIRWSEENFVRVGGALHERLGAHVVLIGGPSEMPVSERIARMLAARGVDTIDATGRTSLVESEALMHNADLLICNDSGPMHLGAAMGVPTLAVFGPANAVRWGPYGPAHRVVRLDLDCSPCLFMGKLGKCPRQLLECLGVPVEQVLAVAEDMLARGAREAANRPRVSATSR